MAACYSSIKHHKLKSGAEGKEEIGDSQEPLRIILYINQLCVSYGLKKGMYNFISITTFINYNCIHYSETFNDNYILLSLKYFTSVLKAYFCSC